MTFIIEYENISVKKKQTKEKKKKKNGKIYQLLLSSAIQ